MRAPEVILDDFEAVYRYYLDHQQNRLQAKAAYAILARRFAPRISYAPGAERTLRQLIKDDRRLIVAANHLSTNDPYTLAGAGWRSALRPVIGRCRVLAKDELFEDPKLRKKIDMMGGIPVFRGKDHGLRAVNAAGQRMMDLCAERLRRGDEIVVFPEGTCNETDPTRVQAVGSGIGHIAHRAVKLGVQPAFVFMGLSYGPGESVKSASYYIDVPATDFPDKPGAIAKFVRERMQDALDGAVKNY